MSKALSVPPSTDFGGNDGTWSTFGLQLGEGKQLEPIFVLPATSQSAIWAVLNPVGCQNQALGNQTCVARRGGMFLPKASASFGWLVGNQGINSSWTLPFAPESPLGGSYSVNASEGAYGLDTVYVGYSTVPEDSSLNIRDQLIINYVAQTPYLGLLGLAYYNNTIDLGSNTYPSPLSTFVTSAKIPSAFYGYNAGAYYRGANGYASLTFGGYDANRGNSEGVLPAALSPERTRDLLVNVESISIKPTDGATTPVEGLGISAFIDSTIPEIWLPAESCKSFEDAFGLSWDNSLSMYLISNSQHQQLSNQNATITFSIGPKIPTTKTAKPITISLPYLAFYQSIQYPLAGILDNSTLYYFPLKRAADPSQYYLGRVFLQEAYLAVDYGRQEFYLSQAQFPENAYDTNLKPVYPRGHNKGLSVGAIVGIVIGAVAAVILICLLLWWFVWRPRSKKSKEKTRRKSMEEQHRDVMGFYGPPEKDPAEYEAYEKRELDAADTVRASIASRTELPSPPLPQYSPGSPGSQGHGSMDLGMAEMGDYWTARRISRHTSPQTSPVELPTRRSTRFSGPHELPTGRRSPEPPADGGDQQTPLMEATEAHGSGTISPQDGIAISNQPATDETHEVLREENERGLGHSPSSYETYPGT